MAGAVVVSGQSRVAPESQVKNDQKGPNPNRIASDPGYRVWLFLANRLWHLVKILYVPIGLAPTPLRAVGFRRSHGIIETTASIASKSARRSRWLAQPLTATLRKFYRSQQPAGRWQCPPPARPSTATTCKHFEFDFRAVAANQLWLRRREAVVRDISATATG